MHAVFDVSPESKYRKDFWQRYDIPNKKSAVEIAQACVGDWIIFRQTGFQGYVAIARVDSVIPDPARSGFSVAQISEYLPFTSPRPFKVAGRYAEQDLRLIGRPVHIGQAIQGRPVRKLEPTDFKDIALAGFSRALKLSGDRIVVTRDLSGFEEELSDSLDFEPAARSIQELVVRRAFREKNFRIEVCGRYGSQCAFTGVSISDGKLGHGPISRFPGR